MANGDAITNWIKIRNGLRSVYGRLESAPARIAYLGASVTAQKDGYRPLLHNRLVERFGLGHQPISAGIGGVGSLSCAFLMDDFVLRWRPALCFVECTTGDVAGKTALGDVASAVEAIVLKLAKAGCGTCILHLPRNDGDSLPFESVVEEYERVAEHHGVPSIHVYRRFERAVRDGEIDLGRIHRDKVHTTPLGAQWYADCMVQGLDALFEAPNPRAPALGRTSCCAKDYRHTSIVPAVGAPDPPDSPRREVFRGCHPYLNIGPAGSNSFRSATCSIKGLFVVLGPHSGWIEVLTPIGAQCYQTRDQWCSYERISTVLFEDPIPAGTEVWVRAIDDGSTPDGSSRLKLIGWLVLGAGSAPHSERSERPSEESRT